MEKNNRLAASVAALLLLVANAVCAQWVRTNGPYGDANIHSFAVSGTKIFAAVYGDGVYRSDNNGETWSRVSSDLTNLNVRVIAAKDGIVFAGTSGGGVFRSTDEGAHWTAVNEGLTPSRILTFCVADGRLYTGGEGGGIFRSSDDGATWTCLYKEGAIAYEEITGIAVSGRTIVATSNYGIYRSIDDGATWTRNGSHQYIDALVVSGSVFFETEAAYGVYRSTDDGATWVSANSGLENNDNSGDVATLAVHGTEILAGKMFHGGLFRSSNNGLTWTLDSSAKNLPAVSAIASNGSSLFLGTGNQGIYRSTDNGNLWTRIGNDVGGVYVRCMAVSGGDLYAGTMNNGLLRSSDKGAHWLQVEGLPKTWITMLVPSGPYLFAGVDVGGLYRSSDGGVTWTAINAGLPAARISSLLVNGADIYVGTPEGVFHSSDNGAGWSVMNNALKGRNITALSAQGNVLYAGSDGGVYRSTDNGANWTLVNTGLIVWIGPPWALQPSINVVTSLAQLDTTVFAIASHNGVFRCSGNATDWTPVSNGLQGVNVISLIASGSRLYAGSTNGVFLSEDHGASWKPAGLDHSLVNVCSLAADEETLYAGTVRAGVWRRALSEITTIERDPSPIARAMSLSQNYPNPFNPSTTIMFSLAKKEHVILKIFDVMGREIETLISGELASGKHTRVWNAARVPSGIYFYRLQAGAFTETKRLVMLK